ncbi:MAG: class I SAM-dependent methyltransferase, partial [Deltaproteobacteria bacterium]|nr:class I SAM-dependent methyltransferase [Deltaproteobacteria bacterium]
SYYSLKQEKTTIIQNLRNFLKRQRYLHAFGKKNLFGNLLTILYGKPAFFYWTMRADVSLNDAVLDVGCGRGDLLLEMRGAGFSNLTGLDPYIEQDIYYKNGVAVLKCNLDEIGNKYDFIMLHHSFEHMPDPQRTLGLISQILKPNRTVLIRIPVACSHGWRHYGINWVELDAPRHLFLHTEESMNILARGANFDVIEVGYDSTAFQFWGSEQYCRDIPLQDRRSYAVNPKVSIFTKEKIRSFEARAQELNSKRDGSRACFYLRKTNLDNKKLPP